MSQPRNLALCVAAIVACSGAAAAQDVQTGIAAWQQGNYEQAVAAWRPLADRGDADAQFNLGQAYRLGRGVPQNLNLAEQWFERAARQRHEQAGTSLGLLLFQNGRAREAMPWIQAAALRGDPRAQYVFGTALFNGDVVRRDLPRAYAMMSVAARQGFPQAQAQLTEMERQLTPEDRERGTQIAADLVVPRPDATPAPTRVADAQVPPSRREQGQMSPPREGAQLPPPRRDEAQTPPPRASAEDEGTHRPPEAGASYSPPSEDGETGSATPNAQPRVHRGPPPGLGQTAPHPRPPQNASRPRPTEPAPNAGPPAARPTRTLPRPVPPVRPAPSPAPAADGGWRVQLGAFSSQANAQRQWDNVRRRVSALGPLQPSYPRAGALIRLRAGPFTSRAAADRVCASVRAAGADCIAVPR